MKNKGYKLSVKNKIYKEYDGFRVSLVFFRSDKPLHYLCVVYYNNEEQREDGKIIETEEKLHVIMNKIRRSERVIEKSEIELLYSDVLKLWKK